MSLLNERIRHLLRYKPLELLLGFHKLLALWTKSGRQVWALEVDACVAVQLYLSSNASLRHRKTVQIVCRDCSIGFTAEQPAVTMGSSVMIRGPATAPIRRTSLPLLTSSLENHCLDATDLGNGGELLSVKPWAQAGPLRLEYSSFGSQFTHGLC